eukprot:462650_1
MPTVMISNKRDWQSYRIIFVIMCSFFVCGLIFFTYFHPKPPIALATLMNYYNHVYIGIDDNQNLQSPPYLSSDNKKKDSNTNAYQILKDIGLNTAKIHLFNTPSLDESYANFSNVVKIAKAIHKQNLNFHLCISYSDTYSISKHQIPPKAWNNIVNDQTKLHKQIYDYTFNILSELKKLNILPHIISIGNAIENGFLLDQNHAELSKCSTDKDCTNIDKTWNNFALLLKSTINAIHNVSKDIQIMVHSSDSNIQNIKYIFIKQLFEKHKLLFDIIG